jgi:ribosomal silencing factor RsfS
MTREQAINYLISSGFSEKQVNTIAKAFKQEPTDKNFTKADIDAIVKAINDGWELRVNEVLGKIRAEIERHRYGLVNDGLDIALNIIDKYKAEDGNG